jgi:hypothetical protein
MVMKHCHDFVALITHRKSKNQNCLISIENINQPNSFSIKVRTEKKKKKKKKKKTKNKKFF